MDINHRKGKDFPGITTTFLCHDGNGNIVFAKRSENTRDEQGMWESGAGSLEFGLTLEENVRKEIAEEYKAEIIHMEFLGHRESFRVLGDGVPTHWIMFDYLVTVKRDTVVIGEPKSIVELDWFTLDTLPSPLHSAAGEYFKKYSDILKRAL